MTYVTLEEPRLEQGQSERSKEQQRHPSMNCPEPLFLTPLCCCGGGEDSGVKMSPGIREG